MWQLLQGAQTHTDSEKHNVTVTLLQGVETHADNET